jgi:hypothetical protein
MKRHLAVLPIIAALLAAPSLPAGEQVDAHAPQPMAPNPPERCRQAGAEEGMPLFPGEPVPGQPGADPGVAERAPWAQSERINYAGSVEHFRCDEQRYIHPVNPYNHRTLVKAFPAPEMAGATDGMREEWAEPVQFVRKGHQPPLLYPGPKRPPVPVVRLKPGGARLSFALPPLPTSLYCVRLIAAIESKDVMDNVEGALPKDLILDLKINDGPAGEVQHYVLRQRGTDNFYSLGEFFFRAEDARPWEASVGLHPDSKIELLVHTVDVHDLLAECAKGAGKKASILVDADTLRANWASPEAVRSRTLHEQEVIPRRLEPLRREFQGKSDAELLAIWRRRQDELLWNVLPRINMNDVAGGNPASALAPELRADLQSQGLTYDFTDASDGTKGRGTGPWKYDTAERNDWRQFRAPFRMVKTGPDGQKRFFTIEDMAAHKPFPDLPIAVPNWGLTTRDEAGKAYCFFPQAELVGGALNRLRLLLQDEQNLRGYQIHGNLDSARDLAILLCRFAYDFPTYATSHRLWAVLTSASGYFNRLPAHQHRTIHYQFIDWPLLARTYDGLFPYIQGNQELANAIGRFIRWVKTPKDVVALLDTYILQYGARETLYFQHYYSHEHAGRLAQLVAFQAEPRISQPWVKALFSRTWEYPFPYAGIEDYMFLTTQRDGTTSIGSFSYTLVGGIAGQVAPWLDHYVTHGGDPKYRLSDLRRYPRVGAFPYFTFEGRVAGMHAPAIGDVGGPSTKYGEWFGVVGEWALRGWRWTRDPRFAYLAVHYDGRKEATLTEWQAMRAAAATVRNPFMSNRSRILSDWGGILEGGQASDDFRFRHAARVRVGQGEGHRHDDSLDLGFWSLGLTLAGDGGSRGGYGRPDVGRSDMHNVVTVDDGSWQGHAWVPELADLQDIHYLRARGLYQPVFERQVALVEVDAGRAAAAPPSDPSLKPGTTYDRDVVLPRTYLADVFRVRGGRIHAYNVHGPTEDEFDTSATRGPLTTDEAARIETEKHYVLKGEQWGATIDSDRLTATWRMAREPKTFTEPERGARNTPAPESAILGAAYNPDSPRKHLRMHLLGQKGQRATSGVWISAPNIHVGRTDGDWLRNVHVTRLAGKPESGSLFAAVWEPYAGSPFLRDIRFEGDPDDAESCAVLHVETVDGVRDALLFAHSLPPEPRGLGADAAAQGHFAHLSSDRQGLRHASLVAGGMLRFGKLTLRAERAFWEARTVAVDYLENRATLESALPDRILDGAFFELGVPAKGNQSARWTTFEASQASGRTLVWRKGAGCYSGRMESIQPTPTGAVITVDPQPDLGHGQNAQLTTVNARGDRFWRCSVRRNKITLHGAPVTDGDFVPGTRLYLYEIGPGDLWRTPTRISLRRMPGGFRLEANVPCSVEIAAARAQCSNDAGMTWSDIPAGPVRGVRTLSVAAHDLTRGSLLLRWEE